jgi:CheY-like chemotaxis protein
VTAVQRTSSDLRFDRHLHVVSLDGAWYEEGGGLWWWGLGHLKTSEVGAVLLPGDPENNLAASAVSGQTPPAGPQWVRGLAPLEPQPLAHDKPLCASLCGFTLHAATRAGALDSAGREALLCYVLRPPIAFGARRRGVPSPPAKARVDVQTGLVSRSAAARRTGRPWPRGRGMRSCPHQILVIDDDELARREPPALVLLDLGMPDLDGWQVLRELRTCPETADVPVALLTGANDCASYTRSREHDVAAFISKPFRLAELTGLCQRLLHGRVGSGGSEWLSGGEITDERGQSLGSCVVLDRDDDGAMLEMERAPMLGGRLKLGGDQGEPSTGEVRWVRAVGQRFHIGVRFDK